MHTLYENNMYESMCMKSCVQGGVRPKDRAMNVYVEEGLCSYLQQPVREPDKAISEHIRDK